MKILAMLVLGMSFAFGSIDINNASLKELISLHGIGNSKANAIIVYRKEHCFKNINGLAKVKGIGIKTVEKNRANLIVGACKK